MAGLSLDVKMLYADIGKKLGIAIDIESMNPEELAETDKEVCIIDRYGVSNHNRFSKIAFITLSIKQVLSLFIKNLILIFLKYLDH